MYKALIVDDEKPVRTAIAALGKWAAFGIETPAAASNGMEGLACMRELHPDIVFVDMRMPVIGGPEFLKQASDEFPQSKYIVVSGHNEFSYAKIALPKWSTGYLAESLLWKKS